MTSPPTIPVVMAISGSDPTGGAGIQADIETLASMGCHTAPVTTAITVQDTQQVISYSCVDTPMLVQQARAVLEDMSVKLFKIGFLGCAETVTAVHSLLVDYPDIPVVLDPVLVTGNGSDFTDDDTLMAMIQLLIPLTTVLTPNSIEAQILANGADTLEACGQELLDMGCKYVLITGTHEQNKHVINTLYHDRQQVESYSWERLPNHYHGSGCTLASAIAGLLARDIEPLTAIREAQEYTWEALHQGYRLGMGQLIPNRLFWAHDKKD